MLPAASQKRIFMACPFARCTHLVHHWCHPARPARVAWNSDATGDSVGAATPIFGFVPPVLFSYSHRASLAMASSKQTHSDVSKKLRSENIVNAFFAELEALPFPEDMLRQLYPELTETWDITSKLQSMSWGRVMACELSMAGLLAPTACLYPQQSMSIYSLTWLFLLHPGSTQTPALLRMYQDTLEKEAWAKDKAGVGRHRLALMMLTAGGD